jgi:Tol biopolymer transport system component
VVKFVGKISLLSCLALVSCLSGCAGYPRLLDFPFDAGGRSLNSPASELTPQVTSPYITFVSNRNGSQEVYLFDAKARRLLDLPGLNSLDEIASHPSVSEDGRYLVFAASRQGRTGIYLYDRETQQKRNLTENLAAEVRNPTISADGSTIAFEMAKDGQWDIAVYNRGGEPLPISRSF